MMNEPKLVAEFHYSWDSSLDLHTRRPCLDVVKLLVDSHLTVGDLPIVSLMYSLERRKLEKSRRRMSPWVLP